MKRHREVEERTLALIAREVLNGDMRMLTPATLINHDLGVTGDDAMDLIFAVRREFDIDISDFPWSNYFGGERDLPNLAAIFAYWFRGGPNPRRTGLSVQALADYVASKF